MKAIVIGSGTIGSAVRKALEEKGHEVVSVGRKSGDYQADISETESLKTLFSRIGSFDAMANAAGDVSFGALEESTDEQWANSIKFKGMDQINLVRAAAGTGRSPASKSRVRQCDNGMGRRAMVDVCLATPGVVRQVVSRHSMMHELFHRVERPLGLMTEDGQNSHLDTLEGRYWQLLEWRALARALGSSGTERTSAVQDALPFRFARRQLFPAAASNEVLEEIREGLAQYTATVTAASSPQDAASNAIRQLADYAQRESLVRDFAYASGTAYGILLDAWSPGWTRQLKGPEDLGERLRIAGGIAVASLDSRETAERAALRYDSTSLRNAEEKRDAEQKAKVAELRKRFVDRPVLVLPNAGGSFSSSGITPIPGVGTVFPKVHVTAEWGVLEAAQVLRPDDRSNITVPAPASVQGSTLEGDGWTLRIAPGWVVRTGNRPGDFQLVRNVPRQ